MQQGSALRGYGCMGVLGAKSLKTPGIGNQLTLGLFFKGNKPRGVCGVLAYIYTFYFAGVGSFLCLIPAKKRTNTRKVKGLMADFSSISL